MEEQENWRIIISFLLSAAIAAKQVERGYVTLDR